MAFFRIIFKTKRHASVYVFHTNGSQMLYTVIEEHIGLKPHPSNGIPLALEIDGWGDDQATIGDVYETDDLDVICISEEEFRNETNQEDVPTHLLIKIM